jgi:putative ABC transport system ATP-binding protein
MSLLELEHVAKRYCHGSLVIEVLRDVSLEVHPGELVAVWGVRRSGRSTLLRIAAGVEAPDTGAVRLNGRDLSASSGALAGGIAYCLRSFRGADGQPVMEELISAQLALGASPARARARAWSLLERAGAQNCAKLRSYELDGAEAMRASIARALAREPALLLIDEPTTGVDVLARESIVELLRSLAKDGIAVLATVGESTGIFGVDRALSLSNGVVRGHVSPRMADVLPLRSISA